MIKTFNQNLKYLVTKRFNQNLKLLTKTTTINQP